MTRRACCRRRTPAGAATPAELHAEQDTELALSVEALARWLSDAQLEQVLPRLLRESEERARRREAEAQALNGEACR